MSNLDKSVDLALSLFEENYQSRVQVFSFAFLKGRLIAIGRNKNKTHTFNRRNPIISKQSGEIIDKQNCCAEMSLSLRLKNKTSIPYHKIDVVNVRLDKHRNVRLSKPCSSCNNMLKVLTPRSLHYTNDNGHFEKYTL